VYPQRVSLDGALYNNTTDLSLFISDLVAVTIAIHNVIFFPLDVSSYQVDQHDHIFTFTVSSANLTT
jgi:hypothetical protein